MSIVKEILEKHGVPIAVESQEGKGTRFKLIFPLSKEAPVASPDPAGLPEFSAGASVEKKQHLRILLAEDNPVNQKLGEKLLAKAGHEVVAANNGEAAFLAYSASPEDFDLIFMDIQMPGMDGLEGTRAIRKFEAGDSGKRIPIVAMTGQAMAGDREKCLEAGMDDYMVKPISKKLILEMVQKWAPNLIP